MGLSPVYEQWREETLSKIRRNTPSSRSGGTA
jgi:hypothetical protein